MLNGHINLDPLEVGNIIGLQATQKYCCKMGYSARCIEVKQEELRPERLTLFICLWGVRLHSVAMPGPSARWLCNWNDFLEQHISTVEHTHRFISEFFFFFPNDEWEVYIYYVIQPDGVCCCTCGAACAREGKEGCLSIFQALLLQTDDALTCLSIISYKYVKNY